jgi:hypothetical protein
MQQPPDFTPTRPRRAAPPKGGQTLSFGEVGGIRAEISELAYRVRILCPDHRDPHRFHEEKSEISYELTKLARRVP